MTTTAMVKRARALIRENGWLVQGVSDHACQCCEDAGRIPLQTGRDPYLYTVGLTAAGLTELLLILTDKNSMQWVNTGTRLLNSVARHVLHTEPEIGHTVDTGFANITATFAVPEPFTRAGVWPGLAFELYGQNKPHFVQVVPTW